MGLVLLMKKKLDDDATVGSIDFYGKFDVAPKLTPYHKSEEYLDYLETSGDWDYLEEVDPLNE